MKTLRDTNNNNSNTTNNSTQQHFSSNGSAYPYLDSTLSNQNRTNCWNNHNDQIPSRDLNQLSSIVQTYLNKLTVNPNFQTDAMNPLVYLQLMNANTMFMQQLSSIQNNTQNDSNIFVPKTRPMTQDEIVEHARSIYQRAIQRSQSQQHNDLMKHFYDTFNIKQHIINHHDVPTVPNVSNIASIGTFDTMDTIIKSPSSCLSIKETSVNEALSSLSLLSVDDSKMLSNNHSILDPAAPIFIPRQSRQKLDDENDTSSSSSDSDFNDFHYLDQFLEEFYPEDNRHDNHLIIQKHPSSTTTNIGDEISNNNTKHSIQYQTLGQGDTIESIHQNNEKQEYHYSIYELLNRYRNPRCHLVLPEWSRLSLILPNVCSMRNHTYKIKRYFAYRRRVIENENLPLSSLPTIPIQE